MDDDPLDERTIEKLRRQVDEHFRHHPVQSPRPRRRRVFLSVWLVAIGIIVFFTFIAGLLQKWLWMRQLHYTGIFWTLFSVRWGIFAVAFFIAFAFLWRNFRLAANTIHALHAGNQLDSITFIESPSGPRPFPIDLNPKYLGYLAVAASAVLAFLFSVGLSSQWDTWLRFRYGGSFGLTDPLFHVDVGFYVFKLPFYELVQSGLVYLTIMTLATVLVAYTAVGVLRLQPGRPLTVNRFITRHVSGLLAVLVAFWSWGFLLDRYDLVFSNIGIVYGAGYTAAHISLPVLWLMFG